MVLWVFDGDMVGKWTNEPCNGVDEVVNHFWVLTPLEHFVFFPRFCFLVSLLSRYGGLKWWRPRWRTQFLRFADVPIEVVTIVIFVLY